MDSSLGHHRWQLGNLGALQLVVLDQEDEFVDPQIPFKASMSTARVLACCP